ncbi:MAG: LysR family transcriptional regulator [Atopobiaceae bacterium]|nr:LysR family transcriptional regulator [Atopobiaceae bacterium]
MKSRQTIERLTMIARKGSFQKAANRLYLSSSALVQQVKKIEEDLGFDVFKRDYSGVTLTEAGKLYLDTTIRIFRRRVTSAARPRGAYSTC